MGLGASVHLIVFNLGKGKRVEKGVEWRVLEQSQQVLYLHMLHEEAEHVDLVDGQLV